MHLAVINHRLAQVNFFRTFEWIICFILCSDTGCNDDAAYNDNLNKFGT